MGLISNKKILTHHFGYINGGSVESTPFHSPIGGVAAEILLKGRSLTGTITPTWNEFLAEIVFYDHPNLWLAVTLNIRVKPI